MTSRQVPLKDQLFSLDKVADIASRIERVFPAFERQRFIDEIMGRLVELELKQRITWIAQCLERHLPSTYRQAVDVLLRSLPASCDPALSDGDFGDFIDANPARTLHTLRQWTRDRHYHVRRLCSEGTRPRLPWARRLSVPTTAALPILDELFADKTRFVTRSVANHLNDIAKTEPDVVVETLRLWRHSGQQAPREMDYILRHATRSLVKTGVPITRSPIAHDRYRCSSRPSSVHKRGRRGRLHEHCRYRF